MVAPALPDIPEVTRPVVAPTDATVALLLLHVPLGEPLSLNCEVTPPAQIVVVPTTATGVAFTEKVIAEDPQLLA